MVWKKEWSLIIGGLSPQVLLSHVISDEGWRVGVGGGKVGNINNPLHIHKMTN